MVIKFTHLYINSLHVISFTLKSWASSNAIIPLTPSAIKIKYVFSLSPPSNDLPPREPFPKILNVHSKLDCLEPDDDVVVEVDEDERGFLVSAFLLVSSAFLETFLPFLPSPIIKFL